MDRRIIAFLLSLLCSSTAWGRMSTLIVGSHVQSSATTATSGCVGVSSSGSSGSVEVIVYNAAGNLLAKTSSIDANTGGAKCANLDTNVSSTDGNLYLAVREINNSGYPRYRMLGGTAALSYITNQLTTPTTVPGTEISTGVSASNISIWLRDSGNNLVIGNDTADIDVYTNPSQVWRKYATHSW